MTRNSWWPSRRITSAISWTLCRNCANPRPVATPCAIPPCIPASRSHWMRYSKPSGHEGRAMQEDIFHIAEDLNLTRSHTLFVQAQHLMPGGVNSPVRAFRGVGGDPVFIASAQGAYLYDVDGNRYLDYVQSWGPMILGHAYPSVVEAVVQASMRGFSFGAPTQAESELAKLVLASVPSVEMIRFVNSGTEATMSALRLARAFTGRDKIVKFSGCYHGHADMLLVQAGSGVATMGLPDSPGVPQDSTRNTLTAAYNDAAAVEALFQAYPNEIAAVIV